MVRAALTQLLRALIQGPVTPVICNALLRLDLVVVGPDWLLALACLGNVSLPNRWNPCGKPEFGPVYPIKLILTNPCESFQIGDRPLHPQRRTRAITKSTIWYDLV